MYLRSDYFYRSSLFSKEQQNVNSDYVYTNQTSSVKYSIPQCIALDFSLQINQTYIGWDFTFLP